jgi:hypothetical protein
MDDQAQIIVKAVNMKVHTGLGYCLEQKHDAMNCHNYLHKSRK